MKKRLSPIARKLHKTLAYAMAFGLIWLTVSGLLLNHTQALNLADIEIKQPWLLKWMQVEPLEATSLVNVPGKTPVINPPYGSFWGDRPLDKSEILELHPLTLQRMPLLLMITSENQLLITDENGERIETITLPQSAEPIQFCQEKSAVWLCNAHRAWHLSPQLDHLTSIEIEKKPMKSASAFKSQPAADFPEIVQTHYPALLKNWKSPLSMETLILRMHNGEFIPKIGFLLLDLFGIILLIFIFTGLVLKKH
jgi:hypothetical protein